MSKMKVPAVLKLQSFYVRSSLFVALSIIASVINYLLYPVLSRVLEVGEFGDFVTIIGLSNQAAGLLLAFSVISIALVKRYGETEASEKVRVIQTVLLWLFIGVTALALLLSPLLLQILHIQYNPSFVILALILLLMVPANVWIGYLQAHKEHVRSGLYGVSVAALKLVCAIALAILFGIGGGLWGFLLGSLLGLVVLYYLPGRTIPKLRIFKALHVTDRGFLREYKWYIIQAVFVVASLVFLQNYDLNLAKTLFSPEVAGHYSGVSVLSSAVYYVASLVIWVLLPEFSTSNPKTNRRILRTAFRLILLLAAAVTIVGLSMGDWISTLLLGKEFAGQELALVFALLFRVTLVAATLYAFYLLVLRKSAALVLGCSITLSCLLASLLFAQTPTSMICSLWLATVLGLVVSALLNWFLPTSTRRRLATHDKAVD